MKEKKNLEGGSKGGGKKGRLKYADQRSPKKVETQRSKDGENPVKNKNATARTPTVWPANKGKSFRGKRGRNS